MGGEIFEDTRQQNDYRGDKHRAKHVWWESHGVTVTRRKLDFGDYSADGSNVIVDTKRDLSEVAQNVGRDHDRLVREIGRASRAGCRLVFLVEQAGYKSIADVRDKWVNPVCLRCSYRKSKLCDIWHTKCIRYRWTPIQGARLAQTMAKTAADHGCVFELCSPSDSARRICELLGVAYDE